MKHLYSNAPVNQFDRIPGAINEVVSLASTALVVVALLLLQPINMQDEKQLRLHQHAMAAELKRCGAQP